MRVSLLHNAAAGSSIPLSQIREALEKHGHRLVHTVESEEDASGLLDEPTDLVVAAGGDGTVATAARVLACRPVPLAILPFGTANNIAKTLGIDRPMAQLIRRWDRASVRAVDLGIARGSWGDVPFWEGVGGGLIAEGMAMMKAEAADPDEPVAARLARAVARYREALDDLSPRRLVLRMDGIEVTGDFLLVEVLNTRAVGPNFILSDVVDPSDGFLSIVLAGDAHREALACYLDDRMNGRDSRPALNIRHARRIDIDGLDLVHIDGSVRSSLSTISLRTEPGALELLV